MKVTVRVRATETHYWDFEKEMEVPDSMTDSDILNEAFLSKCDYIDERKPYKSGFEEIEIAIVGKKGGRLWKSK